MISQFLNFLFLTLPAFSADFYYLESLRTRLALQLHKPLADVTVAVIDTGLDIKHPGLAGQLWKNPREIPDNKIDDDGNGWIDDIHGWDFAADDAEPEDTHGHGTHVSALILSQAPRAKIMVLKYYDNRVSNTDTLDHTIAAIRYAVKMKVDIINYSGGGAKESMAERLALEAARDQGILVIAAAGNDGTNIDVLPFYPASYGLSNLISVTSVDQEGRQLPSGNYSDRSVEVAAPGKDIVSFLPGAKAGRMTGTSQATALTAGAAALLLAVRPDLRGQPLLVKNTLLAGAHSNAELRGKVKGQLQLDTYAPAFMYPSGQTPFDQWIESSAFLDSFLDSFDTIP